MGLAGWFLISLLSWLFARAVPPLRLGWLAELAPALLAGFAAGCVATALDFGGWREADPRALGFSFLAAAGAIAATRLIRRAWQ
jgi:hypothetical protein